MVVVYILKLVENKYYVGKTSKPITERYKEHQNGKGSLWTKIYPPILLLNIIYNCDEFDEDKYTKQYMSIYGIDNVRGGAYITQYLTPDEKQLIQKEIWSAQNVCTKCGRNTHFISNCYATSDINNNFIPTKKIKSIPKNVEKISPIDKITDDTLPKLIPREVDNIESFIQTNLEPSSDIIIEPTNDNTSNGINIEPNNEPSNDTKIDPIIEPIIEQIIEPINETIAEPINEPIIKPMTQSNLINTDKIVTNDIIGVKETHMPNRGKKWTNEEEKYLFNLMIGKKSLKEISNLMKRTPTAIESRIVVIVMRYCLNNNENNVLSTIIK